jgi:hypothetical protein
MEHRRVSHGFAAAITAVSLLAPLRLSADSPPPVRTGVFKIRIEASETTYSLGEPIYLRLTVTNITNRTYGFERQPGSWITDLIVRDASGNQLQSAGGAGNRGYMVGYTLPPGASSSPTFELGNSPPSEWEDIKWWGYNLTKPGVYTIVTVSKIRGYFSTPQGASWFTDSKSDRSNTLQIRVI